MKTQICKMCKVEKPLVKFDNMTTKQGRVKRKTCRQCTEEGKGRYSEIKKLNEQNLKKCLKCDIIKLHNYFYKDKNSKDNLMDYCVVCWKARNKQWSLNNQEKEQQYDKKYYQENKETIKQKVREWEEENSCWVNERTRNKRKNDPVYKIKYYLRTRLYKALKRNQKTGSAVKDLGCSIEELKLYLQSKFKEGMSWENHRAIWLAHRPHYSIIKF